MLSPLIAESEYSHGQNAQENLPSICIAHLDVQKSFQNGEYLLNAVSQMLEQAGYQHDSSKMTLQQSQKHQIAIIETNKGKKFVKIKKRGEGLNEYVGNFLFKNFASTIRVETLILSQELELIVLPFIASDEDNLLFHLISNIDIQTHHDAWEIIHSIFSDSLKLSTSTMHFAIENAKNDVFFFNRLKSQARDGISGRIENKYSGKNFKLLDLELPWEEMKKIKWSIDGISYQETLEELLEEARNHLDPSQPRLLGISHGNWHENNIVINKSNHDHAPDDYAYLALDVAGENDLLEDAIMFLVHTTVYADYLNPVYYSKAYGNHIDEKVLHRTMVMKERSITLSKNDQRIHACGLGSFGTFNSRKQVAHLFYEEYLKPLIVHAATLFDEKIVVSIENHLKTAILLRLLGGQDLSKLMPKDQVKMIGLIYQSIGTPMNAEIHETVIERFMSAL
jgi:hypothetical protein